MISRINNKNYSFQTYLHEATKKLQPYLFGIATTTKPIIRDVQKTEWFVWFSENWRRPSSLRVYYSSCTVSCQVQTDTSKAKTTIMNPFHFVLWCKVTEHLQSSRNCSIRICNFQHLISIQHQMIRSYCWNPLSYGRSCSNTAYNNTNKIPSQKFVHNASDNAGCIYCKSAIV